MPGECTAAALALLSCLGYSPAPVASVTPPTPPAVSLPTPYVRLDFADGVYNGASIYMGPASDPAAAASFMISATSFQPVYLPDASGLLHLQPASGLRITSGMGVWSYGRADVETWNDRNLGAAPWTASNVTVGSATGADGTPGAASSITATAANGIVSQAMTLASGPLTCSADIERLSGTGALAMSEDGGASWPAMSSQPGAVFQQISIPTQVLANPKIEFKIANAGDSFAVDFAQCNDVAFVHPVRIITGNGPGTIDNEEPTFNTPHVPLYQNDGIRAITQVLATGNPWSMVVKESGNPPPMATLGYAAVFETDANFAATGGADGGPAYLGQSGQLATTSNSGTYGLSHWNYIGMAMDSGGGRIVLNGGPSASNPSMAPFPPGTPFTEVAIGNNSNGQFQRNGPTAEIALYQTTLTDAQLQWATAGNAF